MLLRNWTAKLFARLSCRFFPRRRALRRRKQIRGLWTRAVPLEARILPSASPTLNVDTRINQNPTGRQRTFNEGRHAVAMDGDGDYVVTWTDYGTGDMSGEIM